MEYIVECPQTKQATSSAGHCVYSTDYCDCPAGGTGTLCPSGTPNGDTLTYGSDLMDAPLHCNTFRCNSGTWQGGDSHGECKKTPSSRSVAEIEERISDNHLGKTGMAEYADDLEMKAEDGFTVAKPIQLAFMKKGAPRNAIVFVIYDKRGRKPLGAAGFELKDPPPGGVQPATTTQKDSKGFPHLYETSVRAQNLDTGKTDTLPLRIHSKKGT
jgi:hypothetical protein